MGTASWAGHLWPGLQGTEPSRQGPSQPCNWERHRSGWPWFQSTSWKWGFQEARGSPSASPPGQCLQAALEGPGAGPLPRPPLGAVDSHGARLGSGPQAPPLGYSLWQRGHAPHSRFGLAHTLCHPDSEKPQEGRKSGEPGRQEEKRARGL